jgi:hypothetical protein
MKATRFFKDGSFEKTQTIASVLASKIRYHGKCMTNYIKKYKKQRRINKQHQKESHILINEPHGKQYFLVNFVICDQNS